MLKHISGNCLSILHSILQKCWASGKIPSVWKQSIVIPIAKPGKSKYDKNNYRPIALTSHVSKLMEKLVLYRLDRFCNDHNIIPVNQAGF